MFAWLRKSRTTPEGRWSASGGAAPGYYATQDPWGSQLDQFDRDFDLDFDEPRDGGFDAPPEEHKRKGRKRRWFVRIVAALLFLFIIAVGWLAFTAPLSKSLEPIAPPQITLLASDGTPIARSGANVEAPVEVEELPQHVVGAFLAIEDRRFYSHWARAHGGRLLRRIAGAAEGTSSGARGGVAPTAPQQDSGARQPRRSRPQRHHRARSVPRRRVCPSAGYRPDTS